MKHVKPGLRNDRVYLISSEYDAIVPHAVMDIVFRFYADPDKAAVEPGNIDYNRSFPARHTMVRDSFGKPAGDIVGNCAIPPAPPPPPDSDSFIDDCAAVARQRQKQNGCICPTPGFRGCSGGGLSAGQQSIAVQGSR